MNDKKYTKKDIEFELKKRKKPKNNSKFDPLRKNKKFYMQNNYE
jgi:hypothetical protein